MIGGFEQVQPQIQTFPFTNNFIVKEGVCGLRSHFYIQDQGGEAVGTSLMPLLSLTDTYTLNDAEDRTIAEGSLKLLSLRRTVEFTANNEPIGVVTKKICTFFREYTISNNQDDVIGEVKGNCLNTRFIVSDPITKATMAVFTRPFINCCGTKWNVEIKPGNIVDTRILTMFPMFISSEINSQGAQTVKTD